jgi:hypothetical protein
MQDVDGVVGSSHVDHSKRSLPLADANLIDARPTSGIGLKSDGSRPTCTMNNS